MKTIILDLDGVLYRWHESLYEYYRIYKDYDGTFYKFWRTYKEFITDDEFKYLVQMDILYSNMPPTEECNTFIKSIKHKYEIFYITSRPVIVKQTTESYLNRYNFPFKENLIFTNDKSNEARRLKAFIAIDDLPSNVESLSSVTNCIMLAKPWNIEYQDKFTTAFGLLNALDIMNTIEEINNEF